MAGGIDWFRWHHGCVTDEKFRLVGRIAKASVAEVIAVWARLLELASQNEDRGNIGDPDMLAVDCLLGLDDGKAEAIVEAMRARRMIDDEGTLTGWERRQPKREREDDSADRVRRHRERNANADHVTPRNATQRQEAPRGEESRVEEKKEEIPVAPLLARDATRPPAEPQPTRHPVQLLSSSLPDPSTWGPEPTTDDPVTWLKQHSIFGDPRYIPEPEALVQTLRASWPEVDLCAAFSAAAKYIATSGPPRNGIRHAIVNEVRFTSERRVRRESARESQDAAHEKAIQDVFERHRKKRAAAEAGGTPA